MLAWLGSFAKIVFTFTKMERRCGSGGQSIILSACIVAFWLVTEEIDNTFIIIIIVDRLRTLFLLSVMFYALLTNVTGIVK